METIDSEPVKNQLSERSAAGTTEQGARAKPWGTEQPEPVPKAASDLL